MHLPDGVTAVTPQQLDAGQLDDVYTRLLVPAFPAAELISREMFLAWYGAGSTAPGAVLLRAGEPVGVALGERHEGTGIVLLGYLAVAESQRSAGFGSTLLALLRRDWPTPGTTAVLAEIDDPRSHRPSAHGDPVKRVAFYRRNDSRLLPVDYFQPRLAPDLPRVTGMLLLSLLPDSPDLPAWALRTWFDDYLLGAEGRVPGADDADYARFTASVERCGATVPAAPLEPG